ncbi:hypothetical protein C8Q75DRAFT_802076 [Abortiporus biennis]|nr:hypothetical protein C8Q75DRAFT_802076 [Abortiporus biennis]
MARSSDFDDLCTSATDVTQDYDDYDGTEYYAFIRFSPHSNRSIEEFEAYDSEDDSNEESSDEDDSDDDDEGSDYDEDEESSDCNDDDEITTSTQVLEEYVQTDSHRETTTVVFNEVMSLPHQWNQLTNRMLKLTVSFIGGTSKKHRLVRTYARQWEEGTGIRFIFRRKPGKIRVSFKKGGGNHSAIGTNALNIMDQSKSTMNLSKVTRRHVLHEFGHALGLKHEQSSPNGDIPWDKPKVYRYYRQRSGWSKKKVDSNVFQVVSASTTNYTHFDKDSIMLYTIPSKLMKRDRYGNRRPSIGGNTTLSPTDRSFMAQMYPPPRSSFRGNESYTVRHVSPSPRFVRRVYECC